LRPTQSAAGKLEILTYKLNEAYNTIQMKRKEEKDNLDRHAKAEWAIYICNRQVIIFIICKNKIK
jgi:hypothetical protein